MKKPYRVARIAANKIRRVDSLELTEEQATRVVAHGQKWKCGYVLDGDVLAELLALAVSRSQRFALIALLIEVGKGFKTVVYV